MLISGGAQALL